jgi:hypothetical protein
MPADLCFVLMPFDKKYDPATQTTIDFDALYRDLIEPAVRAARMEPIRADREAVGGVIHAPMFERLILCDYAVADLSTANANVFYELGLRHAVRPFSTVPIGMKGMRMPFDVGPVRTLPYRLGADGVPTHLDEDRQALASALDQARELATRGTADSPVFQLLKWLQPQPLARDRSELDLFHEHVQIAGRVRQALEAARTTAKSDGAAGLAAVRAVQATLEAEGPIARTDAAAVIDLLLSYRDVAGWNDMIALHDRMSPPLRQTILVQEQYALALNRAGRGDEAERVLRAVLEGHGPSSETYGLLGRVYKDRHDAAARRGSPAAEGFLEEAIGAYVKGFEVDWRDAYPGVNALSLMELRDEPDPRQAALLPVVTYAAERKAAGDKADYWDHATLLELAVLARDERAARRHLRRALARKPARWQVETTERNLRLIREARERRQDPTPWIADLQRDLLAAVDA